MPYDGERFRFRIRKGTAWRHEFTTIRRSTGTADATWAGGWSGRMEIRERPRQGEPGALLATLATTGTRDGDVLFEAGGVIALTLPAGFTATMSATHQPGRHKIKANVYADLILTDPANPTSPYIAAVGSGVIAETTTS